MFACSGACDERVCDWFTAPATGVSEELNSDTFMKTDEKQRTAILIPDGWSQVFHLDWIEWKFQNKTCLVLSGKHVKLSLLHGACTGPRFKKWNLTMHVDVLHKTAVLVKPGPILWSKCPLVFPLMSYNCSVCLPPFIFAEQSLTTAADAASVCRQPTCWFQNHRVETKQLQDVRGKPEDIFSVKYDPFLQKLCDVLTCIV